MAKKISTLALAIFVAHPKIDEIYMTSDGQGFTKEHKATDHAKSLKDTKVLKFERNQTEPADVQEAPSVKPTDKKVVDKVQQTHTAAKTSEKGKEPEAKGEAEREQLLAEYETLFGQKAAHNIGTKTLKERIDAKKKELAAEPINPTKVKTTDEEE